jgi:colicin import membrane protein
VRQGSAVRGQGRKNKDDDAGEVERRIEEARKAAAEEARKAAAEEARKAVEEARNEAAEEARKAVEEARKEAAEALRALEQERKVRQQLVDASVHAITTGVGAMGIAPDTKGPRAAALARAVAPLPHVRAGIRSGAHSGGRAPPPGRHHG